MEIIRGLGNVKAHQRGSVLTIGNFDGVHHGHKMLIAHVVAKARELGAPSMLMTFEPLPREFFSAADAPPRLTRFREKMTLLGSTDIDYVLCQRFHEAVASTPASEVIDDLLCRQLGVRYVVVGDDFRFGKDAAGDYSTLSRAGAEAGFGVSHLGTLTFEHDRVSSTRIREALAAGRFEQAERLLGHAFFIMGRVVYGRQLGRQLDVPTANLRLGGHRPPVEGVFAVTVRGAVHGAEVAGVANVGVRPTVDGREPLLEVHLFDYSGDLYGRLLTVTFHHKIRDEQAFDGLEALKAQISEDMAAARGYFAAVDPDGAPP